MGQVTDSIGSKCGMAGAFILTLVEVGECFIVQFNGWRGRCTQNILKGKDLVFVFWRQVGLLLFEDGEGEHVAGEQSHEKRAVSKLPKTFHLTLKNVHVIFLFFCQMEEKLQTTTIGAASIIHLR